MEARVPVTEPLERRERLRYSLGLKLSGREVLWSYE